jgi:glycine/D-amino acid oxidase-like deaminating enzyme
MPSDILIVGQGLAGTMLAWEFERAGIGFKIVDAGHAQGASRVAAGIINPITGQRIVKSWRVDTLLPAARESYRALEKQLGLPLWREVRVRRLYLNEAERRVLAEKQSRGELADYAGANDGEGFWIEGAAHVDVATLISATRARWLAAGILREERVDLARVRSEHSLVIDCTGQGTVSHGFVNWQYSKGECLTVATDGLVPDVILNRGFWVLPLPKGRAQVGATHGPGRRDLLLTPEARATLEAALTSMTGRPFVFEDQNAGVRVYVGDKRPVAGRHPTEVGLGLVNGLGAKGTLFAPILARQWVHHLREGVPFDPELDVARLWRAPRTAGVMSTAVS